MPISCRNTVSHLSVREGRRKTKNLISIKFRKLLVPEVYFGHFGILLAFGIGNSPNQGAL